MYILYAIFIELQRWLRLYQELGMINETIVLVAKELGLGIQRAARDPDISTPDTARGSAPVPILSRLFEAVAEAAHDNVPIVKQAVGPRAALELVRLLQRECESVVKTTLYDFKEHHHLADQQQKLMSGGTGIDPRDLDLLLGEIATICQRGARYDSFIRELAGNVYTSIPSEDAKNLPAGGLERETVLNREMAELLSFAAGAEKHYLDASILKATRIDSYNDSDISGVSTIVDDTFFIVGKSVRRGVASHSVTNACAVLNYSASAIETIFLSHEERKLAEFAMKAFPVPSGAASIGGICKPQLCITLNNLDAAADGINKLCTEVEAASSKMFAHQHDLVEYSLNQLRSLTDRCVQMCQVCAEDCTHCLLIAE